MKNLRIACLILIIPVFLLAACTANTELSKTGFSSERMPAKGNSEIITLWSGNIQLTAEYYGKYITLSWDSIEGAVGYYAGLGAIAVGSSGEKTEKTTITIDTKHSQNTWFGEPDYFYIKPIYNATFNSKGKITGFLVSDLGDDIYFYL